MKRGNGKVAISICGDPEDVKVFLDALGKHMWGKHKLIGDICPMKMSFSNVGMTPYCETGSIEFKKVVKKCKS